MILLGLDGKRPYENLLPEIIEILNIPCCIENTTDKILQFNSF